MHMKTRTRPAWSVVLAGSLALAVLSVGGPARAGGDDPSCSQTQSMTEPGPTTVLAHGTTKFTASQVYPSLGGGTLTWSLKAAITGENTNSDPGNGDLAGFLDWTIDWNQSRPDTVFHSTCVAQVVTQVGRVSAGYDGVISGLPQNESVATPQGSPGVLGYSGILLDRVRPKVADIHLSGSDGGFCGLGSGGSVQINRPQAPAPGSKQGNGARVIECEL